MATFTFFAAKIPSLAAPLQRAKSPPGGTPVFRGQCTFVVRNGLQTYRKPPEPLQRNGCISNPFIVTRMKTKGLEPGF